jgi:hypothetical protein
MANRNYNWDAIREDLRRIGTHNPEFLANTVLVGGAACWYYRLALSKTNDPDFPVPVYTPDQERVWLSKDLDFMGESSEEVGQLIGQPCPAMGVRVEYAGATLDFIEEGLKMTRQAANQTARKAQVGDLTFYIVSPSLLFAEKQACVLQKKNRPQDPLHREVLARFIKVELCRSLEQPEDLDTKEWLSEAKQSKTTDIHFFAQDAALSRRLHTGAAGLAPEHPAILHWIRRHVVQIPC